LCDSEEYLKWNSIDCEKRFKPIGCSIHPRRQAHAQPKEYEGPADLLQRREQFNKYLEQNRYSRQFVEKEVLGEGGFGKVFKVEHVLDQR
jgi:hypothetical protein